MKRICENIRLQGPLPQALRQLIKKALTEREGEIRLIISGEDFAREYIEGAAAALDALPQAGELSISLCRSAPGEIKPCLKEYFDALDPEEPGSLAYRLSSSGPEGAESYVCLPCPEGLYRGPAGIKELDTLPEGDWEMLSCGLVYSRTGGEGMEEEARVLKRLCDISSGRSFSMEEFMSPAGFELRLELPPEGSENALAGSELREELEGWESGSLIYLPLLMDRLSAALLSYRYENGRLRMLAI